MRILFSSNAPHALSGYGVQSRFVVPALQKLGHEVALAPNFGLLGGAIEAGGTRIYPLWREKIGQVIKVGFNFYRDHTIACPRWSSVSNASSGIPLVSRAMPLTSKVRVPITSRSCCLTSVSAGPYHL